MNAEMKERIKEAYREGYDDGSDDADGWETGRGHLGIKECWQQSFAKKEAEDEEK